jgi:hypothetical protein
MAIGFESFKSHLMEVFPFVYGLPFRERLTVFIISHQPKSGTVPYSSSIHMIPIDLLNKEKGSL